MKLIKYSLLISLFIAMAVVLPQVVQPIIVSVDNIVSANVESNDITEIPYPGPTEEPVPTVDPYPMPTDTYPPPRPICREYWFEGVFQGYMCVHP